MRHVDDTSRGGTCSLIYELVSEYVSLSSYLLVHMVLPSSNKSMLGTETWARVCHPFYILGYVKDFQGSAELNKLLQMKRGPEEVLL